VPLEIIWSPLARARLREIHAYIAQDNPDAAERITTRIAAELEALRQYPYLGRAGAERDVRELVISGTPYVALYRVRGERITIHTILHGAQHRE
jgi:toxin ParE1/3/4